MLQKIGDSLKGKKILPWLILAPLALIFAFWGATGMVSMDFLGAQTWAAKVNGKPVPLQEANDVWRNQQSQWQQQFGTDIPDDVRAELQEGVLERLIRARLVGDRSQDGGYRVSAERVQQEILSEPAFQVDGKYSETLALARLAQIGITPEKFRADIRSSLQNAELERAIGVSEFLTPTEIGRRLALEDEQREVRVALLPVDRFRSSAVPDEAALAAWYAKNGKSFETPESVSLQYAEGSLAQIEAGITVTEDDLQAFYAENKDRYIAPERRRARHILLATEADANAALGRLKAGEDFATLARTLSKDTGSAEGGGDLGFSDRNAFVKPFADALFAMAQGETRGPIKTDFGFHVIRLEGIEGGGTRAFAEVRADLEQELRRDRAADRFGEQQEQAQRRAEQPGADLAAIAKNLGLATGVVPVFLRGTGGAPLGTDPALETAVFGDKLLGQRLISAPIALGDDRFVVVKVASHTKAAIPPLASVREQAVAAVQRERATAAARAAAEGAAARVDSAATFDNAVRALGVVAEPARFVDRRDPALPSTVRSALFEFPRPVGGKPVTRAVSLPEGGYAIVTFTQRRNMPTAGDAQLRSFRVQQITAGQGQASVGAYVEELRRSAKVEKNPRAFQ
jgi:peptidyl-prolyl cis-trans isomerase D